MKYLLALLFILPSTSFAEAPVLKAEIKSRLDAFLKPISNEYAQFNVDKAWSALNISDKEQEAAKLKTSVKRNGPVKSMTQTSRRDAVGSRFVVLTNKITYQNGRTDTIEFTFIKRIESPYELYDVKVN